MMKKALICIGVGLLAQGCALPTMWRSAPAASETAVKPEAPVTASAAQDSSEDDFVPLIPRPGSERGTESEQIHEIQRAKLVTDQFLALETQQRSNGKASRYVESVLANSDRQSMAFQSARAPDAPQSAQPPRQAPPIAATPQPDSASAPKMSQPQSKAPQPLTAAQHVANIYFLPENSTLAPHDQTVLAQVVDIFRKTPGVQGLRVVGHASRLGDHGSDKAGAKDNYKLSLDRALAVVRELRSRGIPDAALHMEARGTAQPARDKAGQLAGPEYDRRVEIFLSY